MIGAGPSAPPAQARSGIIAGMTDPTNPPAGWYNDGQGAQRYWDGTQWTEHTAPLAPTAPAASQAETVPYGVAAPADQSATVPYGAVPAAAVTAPGAAPGSPPPGGTPEPPTTNILGIIALVTAAIGFVFAVIPFVQIVGWILLPIAFVLSIVALFLKGRKWPAITALILSVVGGIVAAVVFAVVAFNVIGEAVDSGVIQSEIEEQLESEFGPQETQAEPDDSESAPVGNLAFGDTMVWGDGVEMTVGAPEPFTPSEFAAGADQANQVVFTMTITNNSAENLQPLPFTRVSSAGQEGSQIFDVDAEGGQIGIPPVTAILPGQSVTWQEAWSVADPTSLTLQTAPSFGYEEVVFTNVP